MPTVFVIAQDWTLRASVRAELREQGVEALGLETADDAAQLIASGTLPAAVVLDATSAGAATPALSQLAQRVPIVLVASRTQPPPALPAAVVLFRPVRIGDVVASVRKVLEGRAA